MAHRAASVAFARLVRWRSERGASLQAVPPSLRADCPPRLRAGPQAAERTVEFFTAQIRNPHTRAAYGVAVTRFFTWCDARGLALAQISPIAVATYIDEMHGRYRAPTIKQHLAAIRRLFDWLVTGQVMPTNPATSGARADPRVASRNVQPDNGRVRNSRFCRGLHEPVHGGMPITEFEIESLENHHKHWAPGVQQRVSWRLPYKSALFCSLPFNRLGCVFVPLFLDPREGDEPFLLRTCQIQAATLSRYQRVISITGIGDNHDRNP